MRYIIILLLRRAELNESKSIGTFYYMWYGSPAIDGDWMHWNHEVLPHWTSEVNKKFPEVGSRFSPPENLHSPFYPLLGPYSSRNETVIREHFRMMKHYGITLVILSWWGQCSNPSSTDTQGVCTDKIFPIVFSIAEEVEGINLAFHLEPYPGRSVVSIRNDLEYIMKKYGGYKSFVRLNTDKVVLPIFYVYDSYHILKSEWKRLLTKQGDLTIRDSPYDGIFIGLWLDRMHGKDLSDAGFNGIYTYFATDGFSYGSTSNNWPSMCKFCKSMNMICDISVGPGYQDTGIRPWNAGNTRHRENGKYFDDMWQKAFASEPDVST